MNLELISFGLAILLGLLAFGLVKHTADEFDKWYESGEAGAQLVRVPFAVVSIAAVVLAGAALLVNR